MKKSASLLFLSAVPGRAARPRTHAHASTQPTMGDPSAPLDVQLKNLQKRLSTREKSREDARARRVVRF